MCPLASQLRNKTYQQFYSLFAAQTAQSLPLHRQQNSCGWLTGDSELCYTESNCPGLSWLELIHSCYTWSAARKGEVQHSAEVGTFPIHFNITLTSESGCLLFVILTVFMKFGKWAYATNFDPNLDLQFPRRRGCLELIWYGTRVQQKEVWILT